MEAQEAFNVPVPGLVTKTFSVDWSEDNQISLITERLVHIYELLPNPLCPTPTSKFKRSILYATDHIPAEVFTPLIEPILLNTQKEDMYSFIFEEALTPKLVGKTDIVPRVIQLSWSRAGLIDSHRCLLATVTSAGAIDIAMRVERTWYSICNLSSLWWDIVKPEMEFDLDTQNPESISAEVFRRNGRRLLGTAVAWSDLLQESDQKFSYLITAYRSSEIAIWKIGKLSELSYKTTAALVHTRKFEGFSRITKLLWIQLKPKEYLVLLGFFDGRLSGIRLSESSGELQENCINHYEEYSDNMAIAFLAAESWKNGGKMIAFTKNFAFAAMFIDSDGEMVDKIFIRLPGFSITGVVNLKANEVLVSTQDSKLFHINLNSEGKKFSLIPHNIKTAKTQSLGLTSSPSGVTFVNVTSPNSLYDHLINREPSNLQIFTLKSPEFDSWVRLETSSENLVNYWDCFEIMRIRAARAMEPDHLLPQVPKQLDGITSVHKLRVIMWLTLIREVMKKKIVRKIDNIVGQISKAQPLIFVHTASAHMIRLSQKENLNDDHRLSIHFLRLYLKDFLDSEKDDHNPQSEVIQRVKQAILATSNITINETESCNLCGQIVTELPWNTLSCPQGHQLPRCALTLLQITSLKYRSCPVCGRIFHNSLDEEYGELRCLYCDVTAVYDTRLDGIYDDIDQNCKSLSQRPAWDFPVFKNQEGDGIDKDESTNKRKKNERPKK